VQASGRQDEDEEYNEECETIVSHENLNDIVEFTGRVKIDDYLPRVDIVVLTSISEAQPLVILEVGAAGIPTVATDVGACREMILGEKKNGVYTHPGGAIVPLANPQETASAIAELFIDQKLYSSCCKNIKKRVWENYNIKDKQQKYRDIYQQLIQENTE